MKVKIITLSESEVGEYHLLLKFKGKFFFAKLETHEADKLLTQGNFKEVEEGWYEPTPSKDRTNTVTSNLKDLVYRFYGKEDLSEYIEEWTRFVTLYIDRDHLPSDQYDDLILFLYQLKDALNPGKIVV